MKYKNMKSKIDQHQLTGTNEIIWAHICILGKILDLRSTKNDELISKFLIHFQVLSAIKINEFILKSSSYMLTEIFILLEKSCYFHNSAIFKELILQARAKKYFTTCRLCVYAVHPSSLYYRQFPTLPSPLKNSSATLTHNTSTLSGASIVQDLRWQFFASTASPKYPSAQSSQCWPVVPGLHIRQEPDRLSQLPGMEKSRLSLHWHGWHDPPGVAGCPK